MTAITPKSAAALFLSLSGGIANANAGWLAKSTSLTADGQQPSPARPPGNLPLVLVAKGQKTLRARDPDPPPQRPPNTPKPPPQHARA